jgi:hypothetical protein
MLAEDLHAIRKTRSADCCAYERLKPAESEAHKGAMENGFLTDDNGAVAVMIHSIPQRRTSRTLLDHLPAPVSASNASCKELPEMLMQLIVLPEIIDGAAPVTAQVST